MSLSNRELWVFMCGADAAMDKGDEGTLQIIVKYSLICRKLGITPLSPSEMGELRREVITMFGTAALALKKEDIWEKQP